MVRNDRRKCGQCCCVFLCERSLPRGSPALAATSAAVMFCSFWRIRKVSAGPSTLPTPSQRGEGKETHKHTLSHKATRGSSRRRRRGWRWGGGALPDVDETARGQVNLISQEVQQLHSVVQTQTTAGGKKITFHPVFS